MFMQIMELEVEAVEVDATIYQEVFAKLYFITLPKFKGLISLPCQKMLKVFYLKFITFFSKLKLMILFKRSNCDI